MRVSYSTELKRDSDGTWCRWLGTDSKGTKQKFRLGKNKSEASRRIKVIQQLHDMQADLARDQQILNAESNDATVKNVPSLSKEMLASSLGQLLDPTKIDTCMAWLTHQSHDANQPQSGNRKQATWLPEFLDAAKLVAKGQMPILPVAKLKVSHTDSVVESSVSYAKAVAILNEDGSNFASDSKAIEDARDSISRIQDSTRTTKAKLFGTNPEHDPTGQTVGQAIDAFIDHIKNSYTLPDGSLTTWGKTQITQIKSWRNYMAEATENRDGQEINLRLLDTDLADLTVARAQQTVGVIQKRPLTFESGKSERMKTKTAQSICKKIRHFFDWLDLTDDWKWNEPSRFRKLDYSIRSLTDSEKHNRKLAKDKWRISDEEIKILYGLATPPERTLILLGLNCAFGAGEIGNLRIPYVNFDVSEINGIRFKTGNDTRHHLWAETVAALRWELERRASYPASKHSEDFFFLSEKTGLPLWHRTKSGNYNNGINKRWADLMQRVLKHHPDFYCYSFGKFRKTAASRVIEIADAEAASMILAHGSLSEDKLLAAYVSIPWKKLYAAQEEYGETVRPLLAIDGDPFSYVPKDYIGPKARQIIDLHKSGQGPTMIANTLGISKATVHRHLNRLRPENVSADTRRS